MRRGGDRTLSRVSTISALSVFEPLDYLALIEQKINALDERMPCWPGWRLPEEFMTLRRLLEARMGKQGKREFVQVLRLMEIFLRRRGRCCGARRHRAWSNRIRCREAFVAVPYRTATAAPLDLTVYPYLPKAHVAIRLAKTYLGLLTGAAS